MEQESNSDFSIEEISNLKESIFIKYINKMKDLYIKKNQYYREKLSKTLDYNPLMTFLTRVD